MAVGRVGADGGWEGHSTSPLPRFRRPGTGGARASCLPAASCSLLGQTSSGGCWAQPASLTALMLAVVHTLAVPPPATSANTALHPPSPSTVTVCLPRRRSGPATHGCTWGVAKPSATPIIHACMTSAGSPRRLVHARRARVCVAQVYVREGPGRAGRGRAGAGVGAGKEREGGAATARSRAG